MLRICAVLLAVALVVPIVAVAGPGGLMQGDPQAVAEYRSAQEKFGSARTFRSKMTAAQGAMTIEYVAPDRRRIIFTGGEFIIIGETMWSRAPSRCVKLPQKMPLPDPREAIEQGADATFEVAKGAAEAVEGTPTQTYNAVITAKGKTIRQKMYVATQTGYPRRVENAAQEGTVVIDYWDFNTAIAIEPPC
jgi:outer membrane lipoprotein-sorting protein